MSGRTDQELVADLRSALPPPNPATHVKGLPPHITRCWRNQGYHVYMAGPCFDTLDQALAYKAEYDRVGPVEMAWRNR